MIDFTRDVLLPDVGRRMEKSAGLRSYFYGNFSADRSRWETVSPTPRYGTHYVGLRNRIAVLSESYSYAPYKERVLASKSFVQSIFEFAAENKDKIRQLVGPARTKDLLFTGRLIDAQEAASLGLVTRLADAGGIDAAVRELAATVAANAPLTIRATKEIVRRIQADRRIDSREADDLIALCYLSDDFKEGVAAFLARRRPQFNGR